LIFPRFALSFFSVTSLLIKDDHQTGVRDSLIQSNGLVGISRSTTKVRLVHTDHDHDRALRSMIIEFAFLMSIAAFCFAGFLYALWTYVAPLRFK
jgi:hypothetical protein